MKVALVYDRVNKWGGAERVLLAMHELFPNAPLYTSVYNKKTAQWASVFPKVIPSFLQYFPFASSRHDLYAPLMPFAFESFDFSRFDLVISVSSEAAKSIITKPSTLHINYCLTPTRYLWSGFEQYFSNSFKRTMSIPATFLLKNWDLAVSNRPDYFISISSAVSTRLEKYYGKPSQVVFPPVDIEKFQKKSPRFKMAMKNLQVGKYFLIVSRLVPYKKIDLAIAACNDLNIPLVIVGTGSEHKRLKKLGGKEIRFMGQVSEEDLARIYKSSYAFLMPQEEDFGIASLEAQASGKPVIAYHKGGVLDTITEGKTGLFFEEQSVESLKRVLAKFNSLKFNENDCVENAKRFSKEIFKKKLMAEVERIWYTHNNEL